MNRQSKLRTQFALATAICFATLAMFAAGAPASNDHSACPLPTWTPAWISSLGGGNCR